MFGYPFRVWYIASILPFFMLPLLASILAEVWSPEAPSEWSFRWYTNRKRTRLKEANFIPACYRGKSAPRKLCSLQRGTRIAIFSLLPSRIRFEGVLLVCCVTNSALHSILARAPRRLKPSRHLSRRKHKHKHKNVKTLRSSYPYVAGLTSGDMVVISIDTSERLSANHQAFICQPCPHRT